SGRSGNAVHLYRYYRQSTASIDERRSGNCMTVQLNKSEMQHAIAERVAQELAGPCIVNLGIGIPTLVAEYMTEDNIYLHTENGLLGVTDVEDEAIDPNLVNAGKLPVGEAIGASFFNSSDSFAMIRGGH